MLNDRDSNMAANAICHSASMIQESSSMIQESFRVIAYESTRPSVLFKPRIFKDGNKWCALLGDDLQSGVCGFGDSPADATWNFDEQWKATSNAVIDMEKCSCVLERDTLRQQLASAMQLAQLNGEIGAELKADKLALETEVERLKDRAKNLMHILMQP